MEAGGRLNRRAFLGAAAGAAATAGVLSWPVARAARGAVADSGRKRVVPPNRLGIQQFGIRDAINRADKSIKGFLGGPTFPQDPTDLGPLVDLPGGMDAVFEYLASVDVKGVELFQYSQGTVNPPVTVQQIRQKLDNAGLKCFGTHVFGDMVSANPATYAQEVENAHILGLRFIGDSGSPGNNGTLAAWQQWAEDIEELALKLRREEGLVFYWHPEGADMAFFNDPAHPELSRTHKIDWASVHTKKLHFEVDLNVLHNGRAVNPEPVSGALWDIHGWFTTYRERIMSWHIKDGNRNSATPTINTPYVQTIQRTPTFLDAITSGEGQIGKGYPADPDPGVVGYKRIWLEHDPGPGDFYEIESNNSVGPATGASADPGRSLRHAKISARNLLAIRN